MIKIKDGEVRPEECICEPCLDILRYMTLGSAGKEVKYESRTK